MDSRSFLKLMGYLESTDGKNTNHPVADTGEKAIGTYAMMPSTLQEVAGRVKTPTPLDEVVSTIHPSGIEEVMEDNPEKYEQYTEALADKVLTTAKGDPATAATGWLYGHNRSKSGMEEKLANDPEYQKRIEDAIYEKHLTSEPKNFTDTLPKTARERLFSKMRETVGSK